MSNECDGNDFRLYDFPDEILLKTMISLNDVSLLDVTRVCKRFQRIAKDAFKKKYSGKTAESFFNLSIFCESDFDEYMRYRPFFIAFGDDMIAIEIRFFDDSRVAKNHWMIKMIQRYCTSLARISIFGGVQLDLTEIIGSPLMTTLTHLKLNGVRFSDQTWANLYYSNLESFSTRYAIERNTIDSLLRNNRQIKHLDFAYCHFDVDVVQSMSGRLDELTSLSIQDFTPILGETFDVISLPALESFHLCIDPDTTLAILDAFSEGCTKLKHLFVEENSHSHIAWNDRNIHNCCNFLTLEDLTICVNRLENHQLNKLVQNLPKLTSLTLKHFVDESETNENIIDVIDFCSKLNTLNIYVCGIPPDLSSNFLTKIATITQNNPQFTLTLERNINVISNQGVVRNKDGIIFWSGYDPIFNQSTIHLLNLDDNCLKKIVECLDINTQCKLYGTCKRTRELISQYIADNVFHATLTMNERIFEIIGKHIRRLNVEINVINLTVNETDDIVLDGIEAWRRINQYCYNTTELMITSIFHISHDVYRIPNLMWPNLEKLTFSTPYPVSDSVLRLVVCPKLKYLEIHNFSNQNENEDALSDWNIEEAFSNLTSLKVRISLNSKSFNEIFIQFFEISLDATMNMSGNSFWHWDQMFARN